MGTTKMGQYDFSSWTIHMAFIIVFSNLWGIALKEWKGSSKRTHWVIFAGIVVLIVSTCVVGYSNYVAGKAKPAETTTSVPRPGDPKAVSAGDATTPRAFCTSSGPYAWSERGESKRNDEQESLLEDLCGRGSDAGRCLVACRRAAVR